MENNMFHGQKNKGFTLPELMIAGAIGAAIVLSLVQYLKITDAGNYKVQRELEDTSDNLNLEAVLHKDLINAKYSFNNLNLQDDNNNQFFDYLSSSTCTSNCNRSIKMEIGTKDGYFSKKSIYFIIINSSEGDQQIYNPADAYNKGTLNFNSLNFNNNLGIRNNTPWGQQIKSKTTLIFVYSPIEVFSPLTGISTPGRNLSFLGWAGAGNYEGRLTAEPIYDNGKNYYINDDLRNGKKIIDEDVFFKNMPYTIGLGSFAFLTAVKVIRYRLKTVNVSGRLTGQLFRGELDEKNIFNERPVGFNIKSLEFSRETISSPAIYIKIDSTK
jgi:prepilin-type N-terminal cleavage/methylation domain-containing protein